MVFLKQGDIDELVQWTIHYVIAAAILLLVQHFLEVNAAVLIGLAMILADVRMIKSNIKN